MGGCVSMSDKSSSEVAEITHNDLSSQEEVVVTNQQQEQPTTTATTPGGKKSYYEMQRPGPRKPPTGKSSTRPYPGNKRVRSQYYRSR